MKYDRELKFVENLLSSFRLSVHYIDSSKDNDTLSTADAGLQDILNFPMDAPVIIETLLNHTEDNTIYQLKNSFMCNYLLFRLPDTNPAIFIYIGPYTTREITKQEIYNLATQFKVAPGNMKQLEQFYQDLLLLHDDTMLISIVNTLGYYLWGSLDNFSLKRNSDFFPTAMDGITPLPDIKTPEEAVLSMQILEQRYELEHQLIQAVSAGQTHKAELYYANFTARQFERRSSIPLRDIKNYTIVLNTLLRFAADMGAVHPIHIDNISGKYARKIETISSEENGIALGKEMVRKYCLLVKNHSLKGYSLLVRKVITKIDADLTANLSLKAQAEALNVNSSYLSTLFKKETGMTLTEYVNKKRIDQALLMLNSTDMQIQMIAQYCGIPDVNYFTKTFKKVVGKTPKEYREIISVLH